jgi:cytoskeleton protein RodZ
MPYRAPDFHTGYSLKAMLNKPVVLVVVALLVAALAVLLVPESRTTVLSGNASVTPATSSPAASVTLPAQDGTATAERKVEAVVPVASATEVSPVAVAAPVAAAVPAAAVLPASAPRPAVGPDVIAFKVKSSTWVRVTDARGAVQFEKTLASGESGSASGFLPLTVVVGNVAATEVSVHGQAFALEAYAKDNVARFEVK